MIFKNAIEKAEKIEVPARYSICSDQLIEVVNHYKDRFECGLMIFRLGYMQGQKAAKAEEKRKEATACRK